MTPYNIVGVFCEDIRKEEGGRLTLVGVFSDLTHVNNIPGAFLKLAIYVRVHIKSNYKVQNLSLKLRDANGEESELVKFDIDRVTAELKKARKNKSPYAGFLFTAMAGPAPIPHAGRMFAIVTINKDEEVAAMMDIQLLPNTSPSSSAAVQPA